MRVALTGAALMALASVSISGVAAAQGSEEVSVQTSRVIAKPAGRTVADVPLTDVSVSYGVDVAGLDLNSAAGAAELARRVDMAALAACREITRQFPEASPHDSDCARAAADKAMAQLRERHAATARKAVAEN